ncbi:MAG: hypothetical protein J5742_00235 [Alphaproteobacteria bacterium]|nr:hypothetical protein [Alphaproteobacteria bacterium]
MSRNKRLFLFAGYNANNKVDASLVYYVSCLAKIGDLIVCMDSDIPKIELDKLIPYVLNAIAERHGEYDFGSYKRAYKWAKEHLDLTQYDFMYMVNDSVYGPLFDIKPYLKKMELFDTDAFGLVENPKKTHPHIQSWFIGMRKTIFMSDWFNKFINNVKHQDDKGIITHLYEHGFSSNVISHGGTWKCIYVVKGRGIYNNVKKLYHAKVPFIKKISFTRHDGGLGRQINYVLEHVPTKLRNAIIESASQTYGTDYVKKTLSRNMLSATYHNMKYGIQKLLAGKL